MKPILAALIGFPFFMVLFAQATDHIQVEAKILFINTQGRGLDKLSFEKLAGKLSLSSNTAFRLSSSLPASADRHATVEPSVNILAAPRVTLVDGESSCIRVTRELYIPTLPKDKKSTVEIGVILDCTARSSGSSNTVMGTATVRDTLASSTNGLVLSPNKDFQVMATVVHEFYFALAAADGEEVSTELLSYKGGLVLFVVKSTRVDPSGKPRNSPAVQKASKH